MLSLDSNLLKQIATHARNEAPFDAFAKANVLKKVKNEPNKISFGSVVSQKKCQVRISSNEASTMQHVVA